MLSTLARGSGMQSCQLRRREFITLLGGVAAWPLGAHAQQPAKPVIGFLSGRSSEESRYLVAAFNDGLRGEDFIEGQNVMIEYRWAEGARMSGFRLKQLIWPAAKLPSSLQSVAILRRTRPRRLPQESQLRACSALILCKPTLSPALTDRGEM